jgi:transposase
VILSKLPFMNVVSDRNGVPLSVMLTAANVHDSTVFEELVDGIESIKRCGKGRPRKRPDKLHAAKAYDNKKCRGLLRDRGIKCRIARKGIESSEKLGRHRWVVERTLAWLAKYVGSRFATSAEMISMKRSCLSVAL